MKKKREELEGEVDRLQQQLLNEKTKNRQLEEVLSFRGEHSSVPAGAGPAASADAVTPSRLWSRISHEILTPMDAILGMTDLVLDTELTDDQRNYLEMINASADRLFGVISDVIDYSELLEGKLRRDLVNFDLYEELEYDLYIAELTCKHKELTFSAGFARGIPNYLHSDPVRIRQVLNTILGNAIEYTDTGEVSLRVEKGGFDEKGRLLLRFTVEDTGTGMDEDMQRTLFMTPSPLEVGGGEEKYSEGGLGLVVAARLVELFGGEIGVESSKGKGSSFWFTWPVANPAEMYMGELPADIKGQVQDRGMVLQGAKVLLAEDEQINAAITKVFLEQSGLEVVVVENGREAVDAIDRENFQAILMDVQMPVMDGIEATLEIRKKERKKGKNTPIIALTAHAMQGDRERCLQAGMDDYLPKPLDRDQLVQMLALYMTKKALVVATDPANQHEIIQPLVAGGWAVIIAENGQSAMYEASLAHFDMIIIDSSLPESDGLEAVETIRKLEKFSGCRATVLGVGFDGEEEYRHYSDSGFDGFYSRGDMARELKNRMAMDT